MTEKIFKKGNRRKLFSVALALAMVLSLMPINNLKAFAAATHNSDTCTSSFYYIRFEDKWSCGSHYLDVGDILEEGMKLSSSVTSGTVKLNGEDFSHGSVLPADAEITAIILGGTLELTAWSLLPAPEPEPEPTPSESTPAPEPKPDMVPVNIDGATYNTWEEITANTPNLTAEKLHKVNASNDDLLHVNIVGKEDKTVPASAVAAMDKSSIGGLHVFIGESDAVTFLNNIDYSKYTGMNFKHEDEVTDNSRTIDFTSKGKLNAVLVFHTLIAPNTNANVYKVVDGKEVFLATLPSNENGGFCFAIDELAKYVIKY